jgi:NAD+ synthase (glutamine-hydrolysing)
MPKAPQFAHVAAASLNQTVGDWEGNRRRILDAIRTARERGARLLGLPEMCIPGYSLGDRLLMQGTLDRSWSMLRSIQGETDGIAVCVGLPVWHRGVLYNAVAVLADGQLAGLVAKGHLATGDVQYENRWYQGWTHGAIEPFQCPNGEEVPIGHLIFDAPGLGRFGIEICEDGWKGLRPGSLDALAGAQILLNPSASWFTVGKHRVRRRIVTQVSSEDHCVYLYTSLLGCDATRLVFDGSVFITQDGRVLAEGRRFAFDAESVLVDRVVDIAALDRLRMEEGSWRQQVEAMKLGRFGPVPRTVALEGDFSTKEVPEATSPYWLEGTEQTSPDPSLDWLAENGLISQDPTPQDLPYLELELALCLGLREYLRKCGIPGVALALSGGRDSSMCALLVHRTFHYDRPDLDPEALRAYVAEHFVTAYLATDNSSEETRAAAAALAEEAGSRHLECDLQGAVDQHVSLVSGMTGQDIGWHDPAYDLPLQNVQARLRGSLIWMIANLERLLLISTSNKSEAAVGYATMDGDTSGGLAPIADVPKSLVIAWLAWAARFHGFASVTEVTAVPATAELRPQEMSQTDEDDLMPFFVLDQLMYHFVQEGLGPLEMFQRLWPAMRRRYGDDPAAFAAHIRRFVRLLCQAQWKRERFAISFRVTAFDLDPKTGFRFPPVQMPFTEELAELDAYVEGLAR